MRPDPKDVVALITYHEGGFSRWVYDDKTGKRINWRKARKMGLIKGKPTIGYGLCLETRGLMKNEAELILRGIISEINLKLTVIYPDIFPYLSDVRKNVLIDMAYNLGIEGIGKFKRMWEALKNQDYEKASIEMLNSQWARNPKCKHRARHLAKLMRMEKIRGRQ